MHIMLALVVGALYAAGTYLMLRRSLVKLVMGLALMGHAANLLIFTSARLTRVIPPVIPASAPTLVEPYADPLPQALILTAIVIGFGVLAFVLSLVRQVYRIVGTDDLDRMRSTDCEATR